MKTDRLSHPNTCGTCFACCVEPEIEELGKPARAPCLHLRPKNKRGCCGIYGKRPVACRTFHCLFLLTQMPEELRPDRSGFVLCVKADDHGTIEVWEVGDKDWEGSDVAVWLYAQDNIDSFKIKIVRRTK